MIGSRTDKQKGGTNKNYCDIKRPREVASSSLSSSSKPRKGGDSWETER
jgi:hypothetical protein